VLIDPFAGLSTALVEACFQEVPSVGFETHPFFYDISIAKLRPPTNRRQVDSVESILRFAQPYQDDLTDIWPAPAKSFLMKLVPEPDLRLLASALLAEEKVDPVDRPLFRLILSRILELTACSQTDGVYKAPTTTKISTPYAAAIVKICDEIRDDIPATEKGFGSRSLLFPMSSESMLPLRDGSCSLCVTSPPYLNNFDFAEMTRMELYFLRYASSWGEITERVRRRLIVNTTTAPTDLKRDQDTPTSALSERFLSEINPIIDALKSQRKKRAGKKDYYLLLRPYFAQMQSVFRELRRVLRPRSSFHLVVADAALYGVHIPTQKLLASLMEENGFRVIEIETLRSRGDRWVLQKRQGASHPLGEFHIYARRS
jgi:hypothetical protein